MNEQTDTDFIESGCLLPTWRVGVFVLSNRLEPDHPSYVALQVQVQVSSRISVADLSAAQARELAARLVRAADQVDQTDKKVWVARRGTSFVKLHGANGRTYGPGKAVVVVEVLSDDRCLVEIRSDGIWEADTYVEVCDIVEVGAGQIKWDTP